LVAVVLVVLDRQRQMGQVVQVLNLPLLLLLVVAVEVVSTSQE
jgi:hypothetical protein